MDVARTRIDRTPVDVDPYAWAGVEPLESLSVTAMTKEELGHMLRMCGTVRRMTPRDVADGCGVDPAVMDALLSDGGHRGRHL